MGARLGRYVVLKHLASGGMADVLLGRAEGIEGFERHVVLKRIRPENARDQRFIRMFLDEARVAANLHHQHIVQVHDIGESAGEYFIAMEYLHGEDVRTILSRAAKLRQHVPLGCAIAIVSAAAAGLHYAHERRGPDKRLLGIVHRDISPANILVGYDGSIKVVDFGIAKVSMRQETRSGNLKGKVSYMSPEQCKSAEVDRRSDVYALGVVLYELCTTTRLFKGDNDYLVMDQIVNGRIALPQVRRPELPNELASIIMRAIAPDPERRYATADEIRLALDHFAARAKLTAPTSAIAAYMRKQFGDKPEPWLDLEDPTDGVLPDDKLATGTSQPRMAWTEPSDGDARVRGSGEIPWSSAPVSTATPDDGALRGVAMGRGTGITPARPEPAGTWRTIFKRPTMPPPPTESRMGWESHPPAPASRGVTLAKLAMVGVPLVAGVGVAIWWLAGGGNPSEPGAEVAALPAARPPAPVTPATPAPMPDPAPPVEANANAATPLSGAAAAKESSHTRPSVPGSHEAPKRSSRKTNPAKIAEPQEPSAAPPAPPPPVPAASPPPPPVTPAPATSPAVPPPPAAPPPPPVIDAAPPQLSHTLIDRVASVHRRELSKCDGGEELHGEITVRFALEGGGKVGNAQVATSLKKPKVATCILHIVQAWRFDGQPAGAQGTYTLSFQ